VENVLAAQHYRSLVTQATDHANTAIIFDRVVLIELEIDLLLIVQLDTLFF